MSGKKQRKPRIQPLPPIPDHDDDTEPPYTVIGIGIGGHKAKIAFNNETGETSALIENEDGTADLYLPKP